MDLPARPALHRLRRPWLGLTILLLLAFILLLFPSPTESRRHHRNRYKPRHYHLTLSIRNHNVSDVTYFRLVGVDNTVDFYVAPGKIFTNTYQVNRKGAWTLFVEFPYDRYAKSPRKMISRDSYPHWIMEVYYYPEAVGFSEWHKMHSNDYYRYDHS